MGIFSITKIITTITGFLAPKKYIIGGIAALVLIVGCGGAIWLHWSDYQTAKTNEVLYKERYEKAISDKLTLVTENAGLLQIYKKQQERHKTELKEVAIIAEEKAGIIESLNQQINAIQNMERPENEKKCRVHPAILYAFDQLRNTKRDSNSGEG